MENLNLLDAFKAHGITKLDAITGANSTSTSYTGRVKWGKPGYPPFRYDDTDYRVDPCDGIG